MPRWSIPRVTGDDLLALRDDINRSIEDHNLVLAELEQLEQQLKGQGGYVAELSSNLRMNGHAITGLPARPANDSAATSLAFLKSGRLLYSESNSFVTDKTIVGVAAVSPNGLVTLEQLKALIAQAIGGFTPGSVIFAGTTGKLTQDNANFFYQQAKHQLAIGNTVAGSALTVAPGLLADLLDRAIPGQGATTKVGAWFYPAASITTSTRYHVISAGVTSSDTTGAGQVGIYGGAEGTGVGTNVWAGNFVTLIRAGMTAGAALGLEVDVNNDGFNATAANPIYGVQVSGINTFRSFAAFAVAGATWVHGLAFFGNSLNGGTAYIHAGDSIYPSYGLNFQTALFGTAAIALSNTERIAWKDSGGTLRPAITLDSSNNLLLGGTGIANVRVPVGGFLVQPAAGNAYNNVITPNGTTDAAYVMSDGTTTAYWGFVPSGGGTAGDLTAYIGGIRFVITKVGQVGIGTAAPAASALLELASTTGALLLPRMTTTQRDALTAVNGMLIYNTTAAKFQGYEAGAWVNLI